MKLVLKDKNFDMESVRSFLSGEGKDPGCFMKDYGELASGPELSSLLELKKKADKKGMNCAILADEAPDLPGAEKVFKPGVEGEFLRLAGERTFSPNFRLIKLLALGLIRTEKPACSPFRPSDPPEAEAAMLGSNSVSSDAEFALDILAEGTPSRFTLNASEADYSYLAATGRLAPASAGNLKVFITDLVQFAGKAATNKTLDLFLAGKNIQYFIHEDRASFEKEIKWLFLTNGLGLLGPKK